MNLSIPVALGCACFAAGCVRHAAPRPCVPSGPRPLLSSTSGREYDATLGALRAGRLVVAVYTGDSLTYEPDRPQTRAQVSLTAHFAEGFLARVWRAATEPAQAAVLDTVLAGQFVLEVRPASIRPFRTVVHVRAGYTDSVRVTFRPALPVAASCPDP